MTTSRHFTSAAWIDFARELTPAPLADRMRQHLAACTSCRRTAAVWQKVSALAAREPWQAPPEYAERFIKGYFALSDVGQPKRALLAQVAELVFDTARQPLPAGVRGAQNSARHLAWRAGAMSVDLRLAGSQTPDLLHMTGQVLNHEQPGEAISCAWVSLRSAQQSLAATATNEFGEFQLAYQPDSLSDPSGSPPNPASGDDLQLSIDIAGYRPILIPLGMLRAKPRSDA